jgi:hypothetical protein
VETSFEGIKQITKLVIVLAFVSSFLCLAKQDRPVDCAEISVQSLHGAVADARCHHLVLDFAGLDHFRSAYFDEMDLECAGRDVRNLVCKRLKFLAVRYDLEHLAIEFIQERVNFGCLGDLGSEL